MAAYRGTRPLPQVLRRGWRQYLWKRPHGAMEGDALPSHDQEGILPSLIHQSSSSSSAVPRMFSRVKPNSTNSAEAGADSP